MEYKTTGSIPATFENGKVMVTVSGNQLDLMAVPTMDDMRVILSAVSMEAMAAAMAIAMTPPAPEDPSQVDMPAVPDISIEGYADQIRQSFQDQATKSQERLQELANLNESANQ